MSEKIDVTNATHEAVKLHCKSMGVSVKVWASEILMGAVARNAKVVRAEVLPTKVITKAPAVKRPPATRDEDEARDVYTRPPFWKADDNG